MASNVLRTVLTKRGSAFVRVNSRQARTRAAGDFTPDELAQGIKKKVDPHGNFKGQVCNIYGDTNEWNAKISRFTFKNYYYPFTASNNGKKYYTSTL